MTTGEVVYGGSKTNPARSANVCISARLCVTPPLNCSTTMKNVQSTLVKPVSSKCSVEKCGHAQGKFRIATRNSRIEIEPTAPQTFLRRFRSSRATHDTTTTRTTIKSIDK
jgi:hypothetical protein